MARHVRAEGGGAARGRGRTPPVGWGRVCAGHLRQWAVVLWPQKLLLVSQKLLLLPQKQLLVPKNLLLVPKNYCWYCKNYC